jgi:sphingolipid delta-4 desaturase
MSQVGYHNEHHDFPSIPWTRLPALRALAPEFYDNIPSHPSWPMVIVNFIRDKEVGLFARAKRLAKKGSTGCTDTKHNRDSIVVDSEVSETEVSDKSE